MIFLDSSFLISFEVEKDSNHVKAVKIMHDILNHKYGSPVISDYIFDETVTMTLAKTDLKKAIAAGKGMKMSYEMKKIDERLFEESWKTFADQIKTRLSFTDCTIISLMREKGIRNIATFDEDFKKIETVNVIS